MSACIVVAKGGVGESGASSMVDVIRSPEKIQRNMVVRTTESSLCPNTGAIAMIAINGQPVAHGNISDVGSSISAEAGPSDHVVAIVHTYPTFKEIVCMRLGELSFTLDECDFV